MYSKPYKVSRTPWKSFDVNSFTKKHYFQFKQKKKKKMTAFDVDVPNNFYELILKIYIHYDNVFIYVCKDFN